MWPTKAGGKYKNHLLAVEGSQIYSTSQVSTKFPTGVSKTINTRFKFPISAKYSSSWGLASIPGDRDFDFTTLDYR